MDDVCYVIVWVASIFVLGITLVETLRGYLILRDRKIGLLALAFILFFAGELTTIAQSLLSDQLSMTSKESIIFFAIRCIFITTAVVLLVCAIYNNDRYNSLLLKKWQLIIIVLISILAPIFCWIDSEFLYGTYFEHADGLIIFGVVYNWIALIPVILIITILVKQYNRTKNIDTLWIIAGFVSMLLAFINIGNCLLYLLADIVIGPWDDQIFAYNLLVDLFGLFTFFSFFVVIIRAKVMK